MKIRFWPTLFVLVSVVALAAEEAPPAELLKNLDFYQNMNMVQDQQFFDIVVASNTMHAKEKADVSK